jgi:2'-5' RNA ligase
MHKGSIWLIPKDFERRKFSRCIDGLAADYNSPGFIPHITLIPGLEGDFDDISKNIIKSCKNLSPINVEIDGIDMTDNYWRSVFFRIKKDEKLLNLYDKIRESIEPCITKIDKEYFPHLSLIYGEFPQNTKDKIIAAVNSEKLPKSFLIDNIYLLNMDSGLPSEWGISGAYSLNKA